MSSSVRGGKPGRDWQRPGTRCTRREDGGPSEAGGDALFVPKSTKDPGEVTSFGAPRVVGYYSINSQKRMTYDLSKLKYIKKEYIPGDSNLKVELNLDREKYKAHLYTGSVTENFRDFLKWILDHREVVQDKSASSPRLDADIICMKGSLVPIMKLLYIRSQSISLNAKLYGDSIYLIRTDFDKGIGKDNPNLRNIEVYGHKFVDYMTGADPSDGVKPTEAFRCVLQVEVGGTRVLFPASPDCVEQDEAWRVDFKDLHSFLMLKTLASEKYKSQQLLQWWCENTLCGIPRLVVGHRQEEIVKSLQMIRNDEIPSFDEVKWKPEVCKSVLVSFLEFVKRKVREQPGATHRFESTGEGTMRHSLEDPAQASICPVLPPDIQSQLFPHHQAS